jgi:hypothetical protein
MFKHGSEIKANFKSSTACLYNSSFLDNKRTFKLVVDACRIGRGLGAILQQEYHDWWHPVYFGLSH